MSRHTPGPWETYPDNGIRFQTPLGEDVELRIVWIAGGFDVAYVSPIGTEDNGNSNARLIAAAPAMLEALEELEHAYGDFHGEPFVFPEDHPHTHARAVIAKATGSAD